VSILLFYSIEISTKTTFTFFKVVWRHYSDEAGNV